MLCQGSLNLLKAWDFPNHSFPASFTARESWKLAYSRHHVATRERDSRQEETKQLTVEQEHMYHPARCP